MIPKNLQLFKFSLYGFLKNLRFFDPFLVLFFLEKGLDYTQIGVLYGLREIMVNFLEIPTGVFADAIGRRRTMILSFVSYIVSFLGFFFFSGFFPFAFAMVVFSFGDACRTGTHKAMIFEYLTIQGIADKKTEYYGYTRSWSQVGAAVSSIVAGLIVLWQGSYQTVFLFTIIPYLAGLVLFLTYPAELEGNVSRHQKTLREALKDIVTETKYMFSSWRTFRIIGNQAVHSGVYKAGKDFIQPILRTAALALPAYFGLTGESRVALVVGAAYFGLYLISAAASRYSSRIAERLKSPARALNISLFFGLGAGILAGVLRAWDWAALSIAAYVLVYVTQNVRKPIGLAFVSDVLRPKAMATALSALSQVESLVAAAVAVVLGVAIDAWGVGWGIASTFTGLAVVSLVLMVRDEQKETA